MFRTRNTCFGTQLTCLGTQFLHHLHLLLIPVPEHHQLYKEVGLLTILVSHAHLRRDELWVYELPNLVQIQYEAHFLGTPFILERFMLI